MPCSWICFPGLSIARQDFGLIALRIKSDCQQHQFYAELLFKPPLQNTEVVTDAVTKIRQSATGVDEIQRNDLSGKLRKAHRMTVGVKQGKVWDYVANGKGLGRPRTARNSVKQLEALSGEGVLL